MKEIRGKNERMKAERILHFRRQISFFIVNDRKFRRLDNTLLKIQKQYCDKVTKKSDKRKTVFLIKHDQEELV
jgi:hypothetical protein